MTYSIQKELRYIYIHISIHFICGSFLLVILVLCNFCEKGLFIRISLICLTNKYVSGQCIASLRIANIHIQIPGNPKKPCELCYCIRNMTSCVMQECTLHVDGCRPIYNKGVCCPVRYDCGKFDQMCF